MKLIGMQERKNFALFEIEHKELVMLQECLERCQLSVDKTNEFESKLEDYFVNKFYEEIKNSVNMMEERYGTPPNVK